MRTNRASEFGQRLRPALVLLPFFLLAATSPGTAIERTPAEEPASEMPTGDLLLLGGGLWPQGSTTQFSDPGWDLSVRVAPHLPFLKGVIPTVQLGATFFPKESGLVDDYTDTFIVLAVEESDRWAWSFNMGLQLGSPSRRGFFRPRAGIAPGFYLLGRDVDRTLPGDTEPYYSKSLWLGRLGWKGVVGADFFVTRNIGVALEYVYDQVWNVENEQSARYQGFAVGVTVAMEQQVVGDDTEAPSEPDSGGE